MSISSNYSASTDTLTIKIVGQFDYDSHQDFKDAYISLPSSVRRKYIIDLRQVDYLCSAALGMLLILRERAGGDAARITLQGANKDVLKILEVSRFEHLFTLA